MAWIPLSSDDIENSLTATEQSLMESDPSTEADLATIVTSVMGLVRGKVNSYRPNQGQLGPPGTIPDELYAAAISIARYKFLSHLPQNQLMAPDRENDKIDAYAQLEAAATGALVIIRADEVASPVTQAGAGSSGSNLQGPDNPDSVTYTGWPSWPGNW